MNDLKLLICFICLSSFFVSCQDEDFLDRYPLDQVTDAVFFTQPSDMKIYLNQFYNRGNFPHQYYSRGDIGSDIHMNDRTMDHRLEGTMTINSGPSLSYANVRAVNYFFDNYKKCEADFEEYQQYVGEAHFFRAFFYYQLLKKLWRCSVGSKATTDQFSRTLWNS